MPVDGPNSPQDWLRNRVSGGVLLVGDSATLAPTNLFAAVADQYFKTVTPEGAEGVRLLRPPSDDGYHVFQAKNGEPDTLQRQTIASLRPEEDVWQSSRPRVSGPPVSRKLDGKIPQPDPGEVRAVAAAVAGFGAGEWWYAVSRIGKGRRHTLTTEPVRFVLSAAGQPVECPIPQELVDGRTPIGIWIGRTPETLKYQWGGIATKRTVVLPGPYNNATRRRPARNETAVGRAKRPRLTRDFRVVKAVHDLQPMMLRLVIVETTPRGDGLPSVPSAPLPVKTSMRDHAVRVDPLDLHPESDGFKVFCQIDDVANPAWYQLVHTRTSDRSGKFPREAAVLLYGYVDTGDGGVDPRGAARKAPDKLDYVLVKNDPPSGEEDGTAIPDPTGETGVPRGLAAGRPGAGSYAVTHARVFDGEIGPAAPARTQTITDLQVIEYRFPPKVNRLLNAAFSLIGSDGRPVGWELFLAGGNFGLFPGGVELFTAGAVAADGSTPQAASSTIDVEPGRVETLVGTLEVTEHVSGEAVVDLVQYDEAGVVLSTTTLRRLAGLGRGRFAVRFGPVAEGADVAWDASAARCQVRAYVRGAGRNLRMRASALALHPFDGEVRKFEPSEDPRLPAVATNDPGMPYPSGSRVEIGPPPPAEGDVASAPPPLDLVTFESGAVSPGFAGQSSGTSIEFAISPAYAIKGGQGVRVRSENVSEASFAFYEKTYAAAQVGGDSLAERTLVRVVRLPTYSGSYVTLIAIYDAGRGLMGRIRVGQNGYLVLESQPRTGALKRVLLTGGIKNGTIIDIETIVAGANSRAGAASGSLGVNGGQRRTLNSITGLDFLNRHPRIVRFGASEETDPRTKWTFDLDDVAVTKNGDVLDRDAPPQAAEPLSRSDRPDKAGVVLHSAEGAADHAVPRPAGSPARGGLGVASTFALSALPPAGTEREMLSIRSSDAAGTPLARTVLTPVGTIEARTGGANPKTRVLVPGLAAGRSPVVELVAENAGTANGVLSAFVTRSGKRDLLWAATGLDWTGLAAERASVFAAPEYAVSGVRVTDRGTLVPVERDQNGATTNQLYISAREEDAAAARGLLGLETDEGTLRPEVQHTYAWRCRHDGAPVAPEILAKPAVLCLYSAAGERLVVGTPWDASTFPEPGAGGVPTRRGGWEDRFLVFTPPPGFFRWRVESEDVFRGTYVLQDPLLAEGALATEAARDEARGYAFAKTGTVRATMRGRIERAPGYESLPFGERWTRFGVDAEVPAGASVSGVYRSTNDPQGVAWGPPQTDPALVERHAAFADAEITLTGDGASRPIARVSLAYGCAFPTLLRPDRTPFPGGTYVARLQRPVSSSDYDDEPLAGHANPTPITEKILRLRGGFVVYFFSPEALAEFLHAELDEEWIIEAPAMNRILLVRLYGLSEVDPLETDLFEEQIGYVYAAVKVGSAEVVEAGELVSGTA